jgi:hypothetical protein
MGFLSKLFGGDTGAALDKPAHPSSSSTELESSVAVRVPTLSNDVAPAAEASAAGPAAALEARDPALGATPDGGQPPTGARSGGEAQPPADTPAARSASLERAFDAAQAAERRGSKGARPAAASTESKRGPDSAEASAPIALAGEHGSPTPVAGSVQAAPEARRADGESSIITSAPALGAEPPRAAGPPRANAKAPASSAEPAAKKGPMPSLSGESGLLAGSRAKRDRTKSPGFYSNLAPAHAADKVSAGPSQSALKRTVLGVAPPPELLDGVAAPARVTPPQGGAVVVPVAEAAAPSATVADPGQAPASAGRGATLGDGPAPGTERRHPAARLSLGASVSGPDGEEKEDTSPGLGHTRSRHDPALRLDLPEGDLDLLVDFVMDLGLGLASEAWLAPAREAVARLRAAAVRVQKNGLEKALGQLGLELDAPNVLSEERRARIAQALVLVDLALPRPVDVPGQRLVRERLIVQHLVAELATAHPRVACWLRDENVVSLERLGRLGADELVEKTGVSREQALQALTAFREYLEERARRGPQLSLMGKTRALEQRLAELESSAEQFERVADADDREKKRQARRRRQSDIARLCLFLAERGEAAMLSELERCSVQGKTTRLRRWLTEQPASSVRGAVSEVARQETIG